MLRPSMHKFCKPNNLKRMRKSSTKLPWPLPLLYHVPTPTLPVPHHLPHCLPRAPWIHLGFSTTPALPLSQPSTKPTTVVCTIPYRAPGPKLGIKEHLSEGWMRPAVDSTQKPKRRNHIDLDNTFSLIFWYEVGLHLGPHFGFHVMHANYLCRIESHQSGGPFTSVHSGQSGYCQTLSMFVRSLAFRPSFWSSLTHGACSGSPVPSLILTPSRRTVFSSSDF